MEVSKRKKNVIENFLSESERILESIEEIDNLVDLTSDSGRPNESLSDKDMRIIEQSMGLPIDGYIELKVSQNKMECTADFYPAQEGGTPLDVNHTEQILKKHGICYDIDWESIVAALRKCIRDAKKVSSVPISTGKKPITEVPKRLVLSENLLSKFVNNHRDEDILDYRNISPFCMVQKGDIIGSYIPPVEGQEGLDVYMQSIPYPKKEIKSLKTLKNIHEEELDLVASCDGRLEFLKDGLQVNETLEIDGDVDFATGNIKFSGDVLIKGSVKDWFSIEVGGSLICQHTLDASNVLCKKDLISPGGIIGRRQATLKIFGKVQCKFIENCYLEAIKGIQVKSSIFNSQIFTNNAIKMELNSVIVGGRIAAMGGLKTAQIGNPSGIETQIYAGSDFLVWNMLEIIKDKTIELENRRRELSVKLKKELEEDSSLIEMDEKLSINIQKLREKARELIPRLHRNEEAKIIATKVVYPGTHIEICNVSLEIQEKMQKVVFSLDKSQGEINVSPYKR